MTPAEMAAKSVGKPGWGLTPNPVVITPKQGHQPGLRLYSKLEERRGSDQYISVEEKVMAIHKQAALRRSVPQVIGLAALLWRNLHKRNLFRILHQPVCGI